MHSRARVFRDRNGFRSQNLLNCARASTTEKRDPKKASFTLGCNLRPKAGEQNSATESSGLGKCQGYRKEA